MANFVWYPKVPSFWSTWTYRKSQNFRATQGTIANAWKSTGKIGSSNKFLSDWIAPRKGCKWASYAPFHLCWWERTPSAISKICAWCFVKKSRWSIWAFNRSWRFAQLLLWLFLKSFRVPCRSPDRSSKMSLHQTFQWRVFAYRSYFRNL